MAAAKTPTKSKPVTLKRRNKWTKDDTELTLLGLPAAVWFAVFCYLPMFGAIIAFKEFRIDRNGFFSSVINSKWVGFDNFKYFFGLADFGALTRNTLAYNIVFIIIDRVLPITFAIMMSNIYSKRKAKVYQTLMVMPNFMSWVICAYFVFAFLNTDKGLLNKLIVVLGGQKIDWYLTPKYWPFILTFLHIWKGVGYGMIVYLATIAGLDTSMYEAAVIDGASKWQQAIYITLPGLKTMLVLMFITAVGGIFNSDFGLFYQATRGANYPLYPVVANFDIKIYQMLTGGTIPLGKSSATSFFKSVISCVMVLSANGIVRKIEPESAMI